MPPEPWFYMFIERYSKISMWCTMLTVVLLLAGALVVTILIVAFVARGGLYEPANEIIVAQQVGTVVGVIIIAGFLFLSTMLPIAFFLLAVDAARNLREIRRQSSGDFG
jgi:hypothetical protein